MLADAKPADSKLKGAKPTDSALADSKSANPKYPAAPQVRTAPTPECPSDDTLRELAAGLTPDDAAPALTRHAATCDHCGPLLRTFTEDFSDDFSLEELAALDQLRSTSPKWQQQKAREMLKQARTTVPRPSPRWTFTWRWALIPVTAAACALLALGIGITLYARRDTPEKVERLFAQEYKENRQLAVRFPDAPFANMHTTRGIEQSRLSQSRSLLKAENIISQHRQEASKDIGWLRVGAKADILDGRPGAAIAVLSPALARYPGSVPLAMDLAVARFELAETSGDAQSYQMAQDLLTQVLAREPKNCVALFNRAVVLERLRRPELASADWKATLQCESDPAWAAEARAKLDALVERGDKL
jgi:negative regulator of sigma E activity